MVNILKHRKINKNPFVNLTEDMIKNFNQEVLLDMIQATLKTKTEEPVKVPIFIFSGNAEATELAELIVNVKPTYLLNLSNSIESLRNHIKRNVSNNICYIMDLEKATEIKEDYNLVKKVKFIDLFRI